MVKKWTTSCGQRQGLLAAEEELVEELKIEMKCEEYYLKMCTVGKYLFAKEVHNKSQRIYGYRATKLFKKSKKEVL